MIKVVIADDHHLIRQGLRYLLAKEFDIQVVAEVADGQDAIDTVKRLRPDVVVMDIDMPGINGIEATGHISASFPEIRVVMLSMHSDPVLVRKSQESGAKGYVLKKSTSMELVGAIHAVCRGGTYRPHIKVQDENAFKQPTLGTTPKLTRRESEILKFISKGHTNRQIAGKLHISVKTVENHRINLMSKFDVHSLPELIRVAIKIGLIDTD
ncbi:MAG: response regulator transcription factor [Gemmatimonadetes bacterium]|nr:response regulator transcription factor [Gemmatimonadota bacterium]MYG85892.1 response regulator transcription factor [Gemmatimonadota bacterium]MYJ89692.1 response regulator transcription factor [Gemmatimonadota bacterium]